VNLNIIGFIFARGGSKGLPRKNIQLLAGKPLIAYAIETALASRWIKRVIVSTDDKEIAEIAKQFGAEVPFMRPQELAGDDSPEWLSWQHAIRTMEAAKENPNIDVFVSIPPTSPLRTVENVDACIQMLLENDAADLVLAVRPAERNPYYNMVSLDGAGYAQLVIHSKNRIYRRQDAPAVYDLTTVALAARPSFILKARSMFEGKIKAVVVPAELALDIDTELDLKFAEFLLANRCATRGAGHSG